MSDEFIDRALNEARLNATMKTAKDSLDKALEQFEGIRSLNEKVFTLRLAPLHQYWALCMKLGFSEYMADRLTLLKSEHDHDLEMEKQRRDFVLRQTGDAGRG